jgi:hypothetical protein
MNRHRTSSVLPPALLAVGAFAHFPAHFRLEALRCVICVTFALLSVPGLDYTWACLALGTRFAICNP